MASLDQNIFPLWPWVPLGNHWGIIGSTVRLFPEEIRGALIMNYVQVTILTPLVEEVNELLDQPILYVFPLTGSLYLKFKTGPWTFNSFGISWIRKRQQLLFSYRGYSIVAMPYHDWWTRVNDYVRVYRILGLLDRSTWFEQRGFKKSIELQQWRWTGYPWRRTGYPYIAEVIQYHSPMRWFLQISSTTELKKICSFQIYPSMKLGGDLCYHVPFASAVQNFDYERTFVEFILKHLDNLILPNAGLLFDMQLQSLNDEQNVY